MWRQRAFGHAEIIAVESNVQLSKLNVFPACQLFQTFVNTIGNQHPPRLNADDTGIGKVVPILQQLVAEPFYGEGKLSLVEQRFSGLHIGGKDNAKRGLGGLESLVITHYVGLLTRNFE